MKHEELICAQTSTDAEVHLDMVKVLSRDQEAEEVYHLNTRV